MVPHELHFLTRATCGSCTRVWEQLHPMLTQASAEGRVTLHRIDVDADPDPSWKLEFGDRVPVVLLDDEEFACWEVDTEELRAALYAD